MRSRWLFVVLPVTAGLLYAVAFPGGDIWPLAFVTFWPVFFGIERLALTGWGALGFGALFGFAAQLASCYWLVPTLVKFFEVNPVLSGGLVGLFSVYQGGQLAVVAYVLRRASAQGLHPSWLAAPVVAAVELGYPLVFPTYFGSSLHAVPIAMQIVDLGGPIFLTVLLLLANAAGYEVVVNRRWQRPEQMLCAVAALAWSGTLVYGKYRLDEVDARVARSDVLDVAVIQANIGTIEKRDDPGGTYRTYLEKTLELESRGKADLVVWPETVAGLVTAPRRRLGAVETPLLFGGIEVEQNGDQKTLYNSAFLAGRGVEAKPYRKQYLLPFGEYLPLGDTFPALYDLAWNSTRFAKGMETNPVLLGARPISVMICYEDVLPGFVRAMVRDASPELLVNVTDDAWFGDTREPWMHLALAKFRAVEHHRYLIRATSTGVSAIIDPAGREVVRSGVFEPAVLRTTVRWMSGQTVYARFGDWPGWAGLLTAAGALATGRPRRDPCCRRRRRLPPSRQRVGSR